MRKLEQKYSGELFVIGVHSAKFMAEKATENVRQAILRYDLEHPVVNDADFQIWQQYAARAWPTFMFIDPQGKIIGRHEGEIPYDAMDRVLGEMVSQYDSTGLIDRRTIPLTLEKKKETCRPLSFPGKVLADGPSGRLFVADSNHNRVVVSTLDGCVTGIVGSGEAGMSDGGFTSATFHDPQGLAVDGDTLFVADTKNHAVRIVNLAEGTVGTAAGTGQQATRFHSGGPGLETSLASPWDLELHGSYLHIAMAGFHQLWKMDRATCEVRPHAGNGRENIDDGPLKYAQLAQPSGIVTDGDLLYFTDSETSAIRSADLDPNGRVKTIVGVDLFQFGDLDGVGDAVRLQHPIGICMWEDVLLITDTYNNKIKKVYPHSRRVESFIGSGETGDSDGGRSEASFHEPAGLSAANGSLYIADTNNHSIRVADLLTGRVTTLEMTGL